MDEGEWKELRDLLQRAELHSGFLGLSAEDIERLAHARSRLSFSERARLSKLWMTAAGLVFYDLGEIFDAVLELRDQSTGEGEQRPYVLIRKREVSEVHVETIDILKTVRKDAAMIGHPAVVWAIKHWERVSQAKRVLLHDDVYSRDAETAGFKAYYEETFIKTAERNLAAVFKSLQEGIKKRAISPASALAIRVRELDLDAGQNFLRVAWERLSPKNIDPTEDVEARIITIESYLKQDSVQSVGYNSSPVTIRQVVNFLREAGRKYVGDDEGDGRRVSYRPNWKIFSNAFARWYFNVEQHNARAILSDFRQVGEEVFSRFKRGESHSVVWYYRRLTDTYLAAEPASALARELDRVVTELERLTLAGGEEACAERRRVYEELDAALSAAIAADDPTRRILSTAGGAPVGAPV